MTAASYTILIRDPRTLALVGEIGQYESATWTRKEVEQGSFSLALRVEQLTDPALVARNAIVHILRDPGTGTPVTEFAGIVRQRRFDGVLQQWQIAGPDLKWLLAGRIVLPAGSGASGGEPTFDTQTAVAAETALKAWVTSQFLSPTDPARGFNTELTGIAFTVEAIPSSGARGATITQAARLENLLGLLITIAHAGGVVHDVVLSQDLSGALTGYQYQVRLPVDATTASGATPVIFGTGWSDVGAIQYVEDYLAVANAVYVVPYNGFPAVLTVDAASIAADFRRETYLDGHQTTSTPNGAATVGGWEIETNLAAAISGALDALIVGPWQYRTDYDVGYEVTLDFPEIGVQVDRDIAEVTVSLARGGVETIKLLLGVAQQSQARRVARQLQRLHAVLVNYI